MQLVTKVAIGVGVVVAGLGILYVASDGLSGSKAPQPGATTAPPTPTKVADGRPTGAQPPAKSNDGASPRSPRETTPLPRPVTGGITATAPALTTHSPATRPVSATDGMMAAAPATQPTLTPPAASTTQPAGSPPLPVIAAAPVVPAPLTPPIDTAVEASPVAPRTPTPRPTEAPTPSPDTTGKAMREHKIEPGDSFSSLAVKYYGNAKYVGLIQNANPDKDPRKLRLGLKIAIPPAPESATRSTVEASPVSPTPNEPTPTAGRATALANAAAMRRPLPAPLPPAPERSYTVQAGDTWERLSQRFLGKPNDWELYEYNKERLGGNSRLLKPGLVIELPEKANLTSLKSTSTRPASR